MNKEYKSPPHKLITFFNESRDKWKDVAKKRREEIRDLQARVRDLETSRSLWKEKAKIALEQDQAEKITLNALKKELALLSESNEIIKQELTEYKKKSKKSLIPLKDTAIRPPSSASRFYFIPV